MPQDKAFVQRVVDSLQPLDVRVRAMFGAYGLYCDGRFVGIIGDDRFFIKQSNAHPSLLEGTTLQPPYDGAKDWHAVPDHLLDDDAWLRDAVQATADALPVPVPRKRR